MNALLNLWKNKRTRIWGIALVVVIVVTVLGIIFSSANVDTAAKMTEANVVSLEVGETIQASGSLESQPFASLDWKTSGVVEVVKVKAGDFVKAGDIMVELQPSSASASIVSAQADLVDAQKELDDLLSPSTDLAQAYIDLKDAQENYDKKLYFVNYLNTSKDPWFVDTNLFQNQTRRGGYEYRYSVRKYKQPTESTRLEADNNLALAKGELYDAQQKYDRLKAGVDSPDVIAAQAKVDAAQAEVNQLSIIAPFDGQVLSVDSYVGDSVSTGDLAINLANMENLYVEAQVDESDIAKVKLGSQAKVTLDAVSRVTLAGKVTAINPVGQVVSGLVKYLVRVDLDKTAETTSLPLGTTANVNIQITDSSTNLMVPNTAIQNDGKGKYVLVIQDDNSTVRVDVVSGRTVGDLVTVTGNLKAGDRVQLVTKPQ